MSDKEQLIKSVIESANVEQESKGRKTLPCARAFKLAKEHNVMVSEIGRICDEQDIRICKCQLGCF